VPLLLLAAFIVVPIVELYVIIKIGGTIGIIPTLFLLIVDSIVGTILLRSQGRGAWVALNRALAENRIPAKEIMDGVLIIFGGALLLTPGFLTDIAGLILLIPPTRALVRGFARRFVVGRFAMGPTAAMWGYGRLRDRRVRMPEPGPPPGAAPDAEPGGRPHQPPPASEDFDWTTPEPRPADIEGTAEEVRDDEGLPPGERGSFPG
jgi:UPF0716 protein FxsA